MRMDNGLGLNYVKTSVMVNALIHTAIHILIGWILIDRVPAWLGLNGVIATIVKVIGVLIILGALLSWV